MGHLQLLDALLTVLHFIIVGFNMLGWTWKKIRKAHFVIVMVTTSCWLILGIWYGIGYCPLTDWQWQVKEKLGERDLPNSFVKYWVDKLTGGDVDAGFIDVITGVSFGIVFILTIYLNFFNKRNIRRQKSS